MAQKKKSLKLGHIDKNTDILMGYQDKLWLYVSFMTHPGKLSANKLHTLQLKQSIDPNSNP